MKLTIITIGLVALTSCQSLKAIPPDGRVVEEICGLFANQTYDSDHDTKITADQVREFNAKRDALCN